MEMMASPMFRADELVGGAGVGQVAKVDGVVGMSLIGLEGFEGVTYQLGEGARVHHLWPRDRTKADELFKGYQAEEAATLFKRNPLATHRGEFFVRRFSNLANGRSSSRPDALLAVLLQFRRRASSPLELRGSPTR